ncbi:MAG: Ig-like domain-containing protein [Bacteroidales bacterium]|nr:Ig-like domain-containing protein [Bacteroidales bacterium]
MQTRSFFIVLFLLLLSVLLFHCANPVTPEGGVKDITPPEVEECNPPNYATHFSSKDIHITFNEFISLKSSGPEIFISPPLSMKPDYKQRGKMVIIDLNDTLASNTTYIINFGKSISDITEGNVLTDFRYVFSTGTFIDSLMISGEVINAFDNKPVPDVYAQLYTNSIDTIPFDSLPYLVPPLYVTQTNEQGKFVFHNLREDTYKLVVLDDQTGDFMFNMTAERIAFADSLIIPWIAPMATPDSAGQDSIHLFDTLVPDPLMLRMFEEVDSTQDVTKSELLMNNLFRIIFKYPPRHPGIKPLNIDTTVAWCMEEYSADQDTVLLFTTTEIPDTLILEIRDGPVILDTVTIAPTRLVQEKQRKKKEEEEEKPEQLTCSFKPRGTFNYLKNSLTGTLSYPVSEYDLSGFRVISGGDTVIPAVEFTDQLMRQFRVISAWKEVTSYQLLIPDSAFISYNGLSHDTIIHFFQTVTPRDLGSLIINLNISNKPGSYIIQLLTEKGKIVEEKIVHESGQIKFAFIAPAKYTIKAILDFNLNRRWDTGDYLNKIQPEIVFFFPKIIEIRGNWDVEEVWKL